MAESNERCKRADLDVPKKALIIIVIVIARGCETWSSRFCFILMLIFGFVARDGARALMPAGASLMPEHGSSLVPSVSLRVPWLGVLAC